MLSLCNAIRIKLTNLRALAHSADALGKPRDLLVTEVEQNGSMLQIRLLMVR
jgi:hypothetical protein